MKKAQISVGKRYLVKVSGKIVQVLLTAECRHGGWMGTNLDTKREVRIKTAARLRSECV